MTTQEEFLYTSLNNGPNVILEFAMTQYRSAKVTIQASSNTEHQLSEVYIMHDNKKVYIRQLDVIYTIDPFVNYSANTNSNIVYLRATTNLTNTDLVVQATLFDNPNSSEDKTIDLETIIDAATSISSMFPNDTTDYAAEMSKSLSKQNEVYVLQRKIDDSMTYMQSAEFNAQTVEFKEKYINDLANSINTLSSDLDSTVDSDISAYYDATRKIESMTAVSGLSAGYNDPRTKSLLDRVLKPEAASIFASNK
jgi:hypothetical protein